MDDTDQSFFPITTITTLIDGALRYSYIDTITDGYIDEYGNTYQTAVFETYFGKSIVGAYIYGLQALYILGMILSLIVVLTTIVGYFISPEIVKRPSIRLSGVIGAVDLSYSIILFVLVNYRYNDAITIPQSTALKLLFEAAPMLFVFLNTCIVVQLHLTVLLRKEHWAERVSPFYELVSLVLAFGFASLQFIDFKETRWNLYTMLFESVIDRDERMEFMLYISGPVWEYLTLAYCLVITVLVLLRLFPMWKKTSANGGSGGGGSSDLDMKRKRMTHPDIKRKDWERIQREEMLKELQEQQQQDSGVTMMMMMSGGSADQRYLFLESQTSLVNFNNSTSNNSGSGLGYNNSGGSNDNTSPTSTATPTTATNNNEKANSNNKPRIPPMSMHVSCTPKQRKKMRKTILRILLFPIVTIVLRVLLVIADYVPTSEASQAMAFTLFALQIIVSFVLFIVNPSMDELLPLMWAKARNFIA
ncbi:hypothetical protein H4219_005336 [Mycoemilia scoparia]|uniref:Uncharacterized protein n=1 Tax=Mycoemilia scoparia TaxID=417184 RepID=A0A9W7ZPK1_9FUNG|nr:hypothetical protein H4219_005336 [Mycoemilia scoparia]